MHCLTLTARLNLEIKKCIPAMIAVHRFKSSLADENPPENITPQLEAVWQDGKGNWRLAHDLVDGPSDQLSARVHAYLHRKEGDIWNADYWYKRSGERRPDMTLDEEWEYLVERLCNS
jgi:hypothetical protein